MVINSQFWAGKRVFVTGHTGFKGAWLCMLLRQLGSRVYGFGLPPEEANWLFLSANVRKDADHRVGDVRNLDDLSTALTSAGPEIIVHMAAQSLVRKSYASPVETFATNVMGTVNILEATRHLHGVRAILIVTTDKCYENREWSWAYRENDRLGGRDPYSSSKACAELATAAYRQSFYMTKDAPAVASVRAGNVFGGGDWAPNRLIPDAMRAFAAGDVLQIRNPRSVRPWQHVFDVLRAYLDILEYMFNEPAQPVESWNVGPSDDSVLDVSRIADIAAGLWGNGASWSVEAGVHPHEAKLLRVDSSRIREILGWRPELGVEEGLRLCVNWYRSACGGGDMRAVSLAQLTAYLERVTK